MKHVLLLTLQVVNLVVACRLVGLSENHTFILTLAILLLLSLEEKKRKN